MADSNVGRFVWYDLLTSDPKGAAAFYTEVVGWRSQPWEDSGYTMFLGEQGPLGGVMQLPDEAKKMGAPPHWASNVEVADVDKAAAQVRSLGGKIFKEPSDIPKVGRLAVVADPQGATIQLFKSGQAMPPHDTTKPGEFCWGELMAADHEAAFKFYQALFGWEKISDFDMGAMGKYLIYGRAGKQLGGMMTKPKDMPAPPHWNYYTQVGNLDAAVERVKSKGGKLINGPMEVPGGARIANLVDPQGAHFSLHEEPKAKKN